MMVTEVDSLPPSTRPVDLLRLAHDHGLDLADPGEQGAQGGVVDRRDEVADEHTGTLVLDARLVVDVLVKMTLTITNSD